MKPSLLIACALFTVAMEPTAAAAAETSSSLQSESSAREQYSFIVGLADKGLHEMVEREARAFLAKHPKSANRDGVNYLLGNALAELGQHSAAVDALGPLLSKAEFEFRPEAAFQAGRCHLSLGKPQVAAEAFESALKDCAEYLRASASTLAGDSRFQLGDFERAQNHYEAALKREPKGENAREASFGLAWCAYRLNQHERAIGLIQAWLGEFGPGDGELVLIQAECQNALSRPKEALDSYLQATQGVHAARALFGAGQCLLDLGDVAAACEYFARIVDEHRESDLAPEAALQLSIGLLNAGHPENALRAFQLGVAEQNSEFFTWRARTLQALGREREAMADVERALKQSPSPDAARAARELGGELASQLGRSEAAIQYFQAADSEYGLYAASVELINSGDAAGALDSLQSLQQSPSRGSYHLPALLAKARAQFALGDWQAAEASAAQLLSEESRAESEASAQRQAAALSIGAWCLHERGDHAASAAQFEGLSKSFPSAAETEEARYMSAWGREQSGDIASAMAGFRSYLKHHARGAWADDALLAIGRIDSGKVGEEALERLIQEHATSSELPRALYELGQKLASRGAREEALQRYSRIGEQFQTSEFAAPAAYAQAWTLFELSRPEQSAQALAPLLSRPELPKEMRSAAWELAVWVREGAGDGRGSQAAFAELCKLVDDEQRLLQAARIVARGLSREERFADARQLIDGLQSRLERAEVLIEACVESLYLALEDGDVDAAEAHLAKGRALEGHLKRTAGSDTERSKAAAGNDDVLLAEATFFLGEARFESMPADERTAALYESASQSNSPIRERALYKLGFVSLLRNEAAKAVPSLQALVRDYPESELLGEALFLLGEAHFRLEQYEAAALPLQRVLREWPRHDVGPKASFRLGLTRAKLGQWQAAEAELAKLARRADFEQADEAELWRARSLAALGREREAEQAFARVTERAEGVLVAQAQLGLADLKFERDDFENALTTYMKVALLYSQAEEVAQALLRSGDCFRALGRDERAREQWLELSETYPDSPQAREAVQRLNP